jgi:hypothetical protein
MGYVIAGLPKYSFAMYSCRECSDLESGIYVCFGISGQATTIVGGTPVAATGTIMAA